MMKLLNFVAFVIFCGLSAVKNDRKINPAIELKFDENTIVKVKQGLLRGSIKMTSNALSYFSFQGIPYAEPPINKLRFKNPVPVKNWPMLRDAIDENVMCPQIDSDGGLIGDEDCLFLNVFTPSLKPKSPLPVLFFIHGGGFINGSASEFRNVDYFLEDGFVVVKINYRLGVLGFLSLRNEDAPGNAALKDQVLAMKWTKENIKQFGGDSNRINLVGGSVGAVSLMLHQVSPMAKGLFASILATSASSLNDNGIQENPIGMAIKLVELLKYKTNNTSMIYNIIMRTPVPELIRAALKVNPTNNDWNKDIPFSPTIEKEIQGVRPYITQYPMEYYLSEQFSDVPVMVGFMSKETAFFFRTPESLKDYIDTPLSFILETFNLENRAHHLAVVRDVIKKFYLGSKADIDLNDIENFMNAIDLASDVLLIKGIIEYARLLAGISQNSIYLYRFSYSGGLNDDTLKSLRYPGAIHGDDYRYLFPNKDNGIDSRSKDVWVTKRMVKLYSNFMKTGNPTPDQPSQLLPVKWIPVEPNSFNYLEINGDMTLGSNPQSHRMDFWDKLQKTMALKNQQKPNNENFYSDGIFALLLN